MEHSFDEEVLLKLKQKRHKRFWKRALSVMMCLVVFCTTYALILPAITQQTDTFCGLEEHRHTSECFPQRGELICGLTEESEEETGDPVTEDIPVCGLEETAGHTHTDACQPAEEKTLSCGMEETEGHSHGEACGFKEEKLLTCTLAEVAAHTHTDQCSAAESVLSCGLAETEGHAHAEGCFTQTLTCSLPEDDTHTHAEGCYSALLSCGLEETAAHSHAEGCYTAVITNLCGLEETQGHAHADACYVIHTSYDCGLEEMAAHSHTDACYTVTMTDGCGLEEIQAHTHTEACFAPSSDSPEAETAHTHTDACYASMLICGLEENGDHDHNAACYNCDPVCEREEHQHTLECYSDPNADLESASDWEATLPETLTGIYADDLLAVAKSQLGYTESTRNYIVDDSGEIKGYTRYGDWYGIPYGDWCAMFVSFCLDYANIEEFPQDCNCPNWIVALQEQELYVPASGYIPKSGDIIFFDWNGDTSSDHVGIIAEYFPEDDYNAARIQCIEGNSGNTVRYTTYNLADPTIQGYGQLPLRKDEILTEEETVPDDPETDSFDAVANVVEMAANDGATYSVTGRSGLMMLASPSASARAAETIDMTDLIETVTVYKKLNGSWVEVGTGGSITDGEDLKFTINYTVPGEVLSNTKNTLVYQIPSNIKNVADSSGLVYNDAKEEVGTYVIDAASNSISITFFDTYVQDNQLNKPIIGSISFKATVEKITQEGSENQEIVFADNAKIEMEVVEKEDVIGDVKVEKSVAKVNGATLTYEIKVTSQTGTFSDVTLTDKMTGGIHYSGGLTVKDKNNRTVAYTLNPSYPYNEFTLTLPKMAAGQVYTITYNATPSGMIESHAPVGNKATVTSKNNQNLDISDFAEVDYAFKFVNKVGKLLADGSIEWTIVINEEKKDISGAVLRDIMTDTDGSEGDFTGPVTITDSKGNSQQITLPFTFPSGSKDTYTITYITTHDVVAGISSVKNLVGLRYNGENDWFVDDEEVVIGENEPIAKAGEFLGRDPETGKFLIQWTITLDTTGGALPTTAYIHDATYDTQYMTYAQLKAAFAAAEKATGATISNKLAIIYGGYTEVWNEDIDAAGDSNVYNQFYIQFSKEIPRGKRISFSYTTTADTPPDTGLYYNQVSVNDKVIAGANARHEYQHPVVEKIGVEVIEQENGSKTYVFTEDKKELDYETLSKVNGENTLWWRLRLQVPKGVYPVVLKDTLPEGLELVGVIGQLWQSSNPELQKIMYPDANGYAETAWFSSATSPGYRLSLQTSTGADGRQIVTFDVDDMAYYIGYQGTYLDLYLVCRFRDDFQWGDPNAVITQVPFANTVQVESPDGEVFDTDDHTFVVRYDQSGEVVSKLGTMTALNELEYEVKLNVDARNLDPVKDTLRVKDVLTYVSPAACPVRLYLKPGSVNVYDYTGGVKGALITSAKYTYTENTSGTGDISYTHTLDLQLPDEQAMLLEYVYTVDGEPNDYYSYDMLNTCTITGIASGGIEGDYQLEVKVNESDAQANVTGIYIYKVNADNNGLYLPGAVFNVYTWSSRTGQYVRVKHPNTSGKEEAHYAFTTDEDGCLMLNGTTMEAIAYNTAYYITEVTPPSGYFNDPTPYYFYIQHADTNKNPVNIPAGFEGDALKTGALVYYYNEPATTQIVVQKKWQDHNGNPITVKADQVESVSFELWQKLEGAENSDTLYGTYTITPDANGIWKTTITGLPKGVVNARDGTKGASYLYYIKEVAAFGYEVSYEYDDENDATIHDSDGINNGTISMTNREAEGYELPETGGTGTYMYTMAGLMLMLISTAFLLYKLRKRRREAF